MSTDWEISNEEFWTAETGNSSNEADELKELADGFQGYEAIDFSWYVQHVADRLFNIHLHRGVIGEFLFTLTCNADGEQDGGEVALSIPGSLFYLMRSLEWKRMTDDRDATGEAGLIAIKDCLMGEYAGLRTFANRHGLWT